MIIIDFLVYYLTCWFEKNKKKLVWSTPLERAIYAVVLALTGIFVIIEISLENTIWKQNGFKTPTALVILAGLGLIQLLKFIYAKRGRYESVASKRFNMNKKAGEIISLVVVLMCMSGWIIGYMIISYFFMGKK
ncbi:MAG: hypothetical protein KGM16_13830 [Bacteroidota bacterium]|nr:hypothetical protein [Bacteroidota bacterium]